MQSDALEAKPKIQTARDQTQQHRTGVSQRIQVSWLPPQSEIRRQTAVELRSASDQPEHPSSQTAAQLRPTRADPSSRLQESSEQPLKIQQHSFSIMPRRHFSGHSGLAELTAPFNRHLAGYSQNKIQHQRLQRLHHRVKSRPSCAHSIKFKPCAHGQPGIQA